MKTLCVYHRMDLDGWMSAAIVKHWWNSIMHNPNDEIEFIGYHYGDPIPDTNKYEQIIMCDVSFPKDIMRELFELRINNFVWLDHHISAIKDVGSFIPMEFTPDVAVKHAACELTWMYFFPDDEIPEIVRLLGLYDSFRHKGTVEERKVLEYQYGFRSIISNYKEAYQWLITCNNSKQSLYDIGAKGIGIYNYLCIEAKQAYDNGFTISFENTDRSKGDLNNFYFIGINKERFNPINFSIDYHKDGYDGAACFHFNGKDWNFSLYNDNGTIDVSSIAKQYGGGGHRGAAGFRIDNINKLI